MLVYQNNNYIYGGKMLKIRIRLAHKILSMVISIILLMSVATIFSVYLQVRNINKISIDKQLNSNYNMMVSLCESKIANFIRDQSL